MKPGYFVGALVVFFCILVTAMALSGTVRRTVTFAEARSSQQPCEVYGEIVKGSLVHDAKSGGFTFRAMEKKSGEVLTIRSLKPKPSSFDQADHVKAIGQVSGVEFVAHDLLVKCPSKYQGESAKASEGKETQ